MKKCLTCDNKFENENNYLCRSCYNEVKKWKKEFENYSADDNKEEFYRWKRNAYLSKGTIYETSYIHKAIANAELYKEKTGDNKLLNWALDLSNKSKTNITGKDDQAEENRATSINENDLEKEFEELNKDETIKDVKDYNERNRCQDGHRVISKSEKIIDDMLTRLGIRHSYDTPIDNNTKFRTDFKLLDYDVYIEHWGYKNRINYEERRRIKTEYYNRHGYILIDSDEDTIHDEEYLKEEIRKACKGIKFKD